MEKIYGDLEVHCSFNNTDKCDFATVIDNECIYNVNMICSLPTVFRKLVAAQKKEEAQNTIDNKQSDEIKKAYWKGYEDGKNR